MKKKYLALILLVGFVAAVAFAVVVKPVLDDRVVVAPVNMKIDRSDIDLAFTYLSGESAYTLIEPPVPAADGVAAMSVFLLMDTGEYIKYQNGKGDTPASVSVFVVELPEDGVEVEGGRIARLQHWAGANTQLSSFAARVSEPEVIEIDGVKALQYRTEGQYEQEVHLVMYSGRVYVFTGQFENESDDIYSMYKDLINSVTFY